MNIHMAKKGPEMVVQRSFIKEHSFPYRLYVFWKLTGKKKLYFACMQVCNANTLQYNILIAHMQY